MRFWPHIFIILNLIFGAQLSLALPSTLWGEGILFYRSPKSLFPSGQSSQKDLEKSAKKMDLNLSYNVLWNQKEFRVTTDQLLQSLQTSTLAKPRVSTRLRDLPMESSAQTVSVNETDILNIVKVSSPWAFVQNSKNDQQKGWVHFDQLKALRDDRGLFVSLIDSYIRAAPYQGAPILSTAIKNSRWVPLKILDEWVEIQWEGHKAYLDLAHLAHRADFANWAYHIRHGWIRVLAKSGGIVYSVSKEKFQLKDFIAFETDPQKAIMQESLDHGPQIRSRVKIKNTQAERWILSTLEGHGDVWWKKEILKNTIDLEKMSEKSKEIEEQNLPHCTHPDGVKFAGSFRSFDHGQSYEPYLRWDQITNLIQNEIHHPPLLLKLTKIAALKNSEVEITIDTGYHPVRLRGHVLGQFWRVTR